MRCTDTVQQTATRYPLHIQHDGQPVAAATHLVRRPPSDRTHPLLEKQEIINRSQDSDLINPLDSIEAKVWQAFSGDGSRRPSPLASSPEYPSSVSPIELPVVGAEVRPVYIATDDYRCLPRDDGSSLSLTEGDRVTVFDKTRQHTRVSRVRSATTEQSHSARFNFASGDWFLARLTTDSITRDADADVCAFSRLINLLLTCLPAF